MAENEKKSESIGERLERELGRPVTLAECEKEAMRIERDQYKAEIESKSASLVQITQKFEELRLYHECAIMGAIKSSGREKWVSLRQAIASCWTKTSKTLIQSHSGEHGMLPI